VPGSTGDLRLAKLLRPRRRSTTQLEEEREDRMRVLVVELAD
jgi:hypothetical protein